MDGSGLRQPPIRLGTGVSLRLRDRVGSGVALFDGKVWITQQSDPRDIFLGAGESFVFDRPGLALVQAVVGSTLQLFELEPDARPKRPQDVTARSGAA
jgi:hypothetical protein